MNCYRYQNLGDTAKKSGVSLKKKQSLSLAIADSSLLPLQYSALAQRSQANAEISGPLTKWSVSKKANRRELPLAHLLEKKGCETKCFWNCFGRITSHRSSTLLLHSNEFAHNYHVALSLLWVAGDESNLK